MPGCATDPAAGSRHGRLHRRASRLHPVLLRACLRSARHHLLCNSAHRGRWHRVGLVGFVRPDPRDQRVARSCRTGDRRCSEVCRHPPGCDGGVLSPPAGIRPPQFAAARLVASGRLDPRTTGDARSACGCSWRVQHRECTLPLHTRLFWSRGDGCGFRPDRSSAAGAGAGPGVPRGGGMDTLWDRRRPRRSLRPVLACERTQPEMVPGNDRDSNSAHPRIDRLLSGYRNLGNLGPEADLGG